MRPAMRLGGPARRRQLTSHVLPAAIAAQPQNTQKHHRRKCCGRFEMEGQLTGQAASAAGQEMRIAAAAELAAEQVAAVTLAPPNTQAVVGLVGRMLLWTLEARWKRDDEKARENWVTLNMAGCLSHMQTRRIFTQKPCN